MAFEHLRIKFDQCGHQDSLRHYWNDLCSLLVKRGTTSPLSDVVACAWFQRPIIYFLLVEKDLSSFSFCKSSSRGCRAATFLLLSKSWLSVLPRLVGLTVAGIGHFLIYCYTLGAALLFERRERLVSGANTLLLPCVFHAVRHFMESANWKYYTKRFPWLFPNTYFCVIRN
jgi:hypothetical protein